MVPATELRLSDAAAMSAEGAGAEWRQINHVGLNRLQRRSQEEIESFFPPEQSVVWHFGLHHRLTAMIRPRRSEASDQRAAFLRARAGRPAQAVVGSLAPGAAP